MVSFIRVGMVNIPCQLVNCVNNSQKRISFNQVHLKDKGSVGYKKYCKECNKELLAHEIGKKYGDKILNQDDIDRVKQYFENQIIEVLGFSDIEVKKKKRFFYNTYEVIADLSKSAKRLFQKNFLAFSEALRESKLVGVCRYTTRGQQHLGLLYWDGESVVLSLIPFNEAINQYDVERLREEVENLGIKKQELEPLKREAKKFIENYRFKGSLSKVKNLVKEKYEALLSGVKKIDVEFKVKEENVFAIANKVRK